MSRAECPRCGKSVSILKDGTIRVHNSYERDGNWGVRCPSSGQKAETR